MKRIFKRVSAAVTALAVMLTAVVFDVPEKIAAEAETSAKGGCDANHEGMTAWTSTNSLPTNGNYYLDVDVTIESMKDYNVATISTGNNVTLCLNGHNIIAKGASNNPIRMFYVTGGSLTLCDCKGTGKLTGGYSASSSGGAVMVFGGTFTMNGGIITGNTVNTQGGGVQVSKGTFIMNGGTISDNTTFNTAGSNGGGGVCVTSGTFTMNGGTISGNTAASNGGGVYVTNSGIFEMNGGTISGNTAGSNGGGVLFSGGTFTINGNVDITGNTLSNVYLTKDKTITIESSFDASSKIGITTITTPNCQNYVDVTAACSDVSSSFTADINGQNIVYNSGKVQLAKDHNYKTAWTTDETQHWHACSVCDDKKDIEAHTWSDWTVTTPATCTAAGVKTSTCAVCGKTKTETIAALKHDYSTTWETDGTYHWHFCTRTNCPTSAISGKAEHNFTQKKDDVNHWQECTECGFKKDITAHTFKPKNDDTNHWQQCTCGAEKDIEAHVYTDKTNDECFWQECSCGHVKGKREHTFTQKHDETNHWYECEICHHIKNETEHIFMPNKDDSKHWQECSCGYKEGETAHEWGNWSLTAEPTVNKTGTAERTCTCGEKQTKTDVSVLTDTTVWTKDETTNPTITGIGLYTYTSVYGKVTVDIPELSNTEVWTKDEEESTDPTITAPGIYVYESKEYGEVTIELPALGDTDENGESVWTKNEEESTDPTITAPGTYVYESKEYGEVTIEVPALGDTDVWTLDESQHVDPTEDQPGQDVYISEYGEVTVIVPPHMHTYSSEWTSDETNHWHASTCGHDVKSGESAHTWNDGEITKQPTADETGVKTFTCTVCDKTKTEIISATGGTENPDPDNPNPDNPNPDNPDPDNPNPDNPNPDNPNPDNPNPDNPDPDNPNPDNPNPDNPNPDNPDPDNPNPDNPNPDNPDPDTPDPDNPNPDNPNPDNPDPNNPDPDNPDPDNPDNPDNPDDTDNGNILKEVQPGENAPDTELKTPLDELVDAVLTPEEQALVDDGVEIKIVLTVEDGTDSVPEDDKEKVETAISGLSDCKIGQYLDVNLLKIIGDDQEKVTETNAPITLIFAVPEALSGEGRTYSVIRVHDGEADVLPDLDSDINTVTIETDKFSTYALAYSEKTNVTPPDGGSSGGDFTVPDQSGSDGNDTAPSESETTDVSGSAPTESNSADGGNTISENSGSSDNGTTSPSGEASSTDDNGTNSEVGTASINDNNSTPTESAATTDNNDGNPSTGIAVTFIPPVAAITVLTAAVKRKKK